MADDDSLEQNAVATLDPALRQLIASLEPAGLETHALPPAAMVSAATAVSLAKMALAAEDVPDKLQLAMAASYAANFFGLPRNNLLYVIDEVCGTFALTSAQRRDYHASAAALLDDYVLSLQKGSAMSGAYRDGSLGILQNGAFRDGSLGMLQAGAFKDGSLGILQQGAFHDGSLGKVYTSRADQGIANRNLDRALLALIMDQTAQSIALQVRAILGTRPSLTKVKLAVTVGRLAHDLGSPSAASLGLRIIQVAAGLCGALGNSQATCNAITGPVLVPSSDKSPMRFASVGFRRSARVGGQLRGLGGGCGCSGVGDDAAPTPFYKKPLVIGGAAAALAVTIWAVTRK